MPTVWDFADEGAGKINMQSSTVVGKGRRTSAFAVIAIAGATIFGSTEAAVVWHDTGVASANVIRIDKAARSANPSRQARKLRDQLSPDTNVGMSTGRLAATAKRLFADIEEPGVDLDYSFG